MASNTWHRAFFAGALSISTLCCSAGFASPLYTHFLFFPNRIIKPTPAQIDGVVPETVNIKLGNQHLNGWYFGKPRAPYVVLVSHGNAGNISSVEWIAHNLLCAGVSVLLYDYRNYGTSSRAPVTIASICEDGNAAYKYLVQNKNFKPENIILYGQSLGCAVACNISKDNPAAALILQSGFSSLRNVAFERFPLLQHAPRLVPDALDNESILSHSKLPVLLIHGDKDRIVPFQNAKELYDAAAGPKWLVVCHNTGHHIFPKSDMQHRSAVADFIARIPENDAH